MDSSEQKDIILDTGEFTRNVQYFCGTVLLHYHESLTENELYVCKQLIKGQSLQSVSMTLGLSRERIRQIFHKAIKKIRVAFQATIDEISALKEENDELKHRRLLLEYELLNTQCLQKVETVLSQEKELCNNAIRLLRTPIQFLKLSTRLEKALKKANITKFSEIPLLSEDILYKKKRYGKKTVFDIQNYLQKYSLELNLTYEDVVTRMASLSNDDIPSDTFKGYTIEDIDKELAELLPKCDETSK